MTTETESPVFKEFRLFTAGREPGIDAIAIMCELLRDMPENERRAAVYYVADKFGFVDLSQAALRR